MQIDETQLTIKGLLETINPRIIAATEMVEHLIEEQRQDLQGPQPLRRRRERRQLRNRGAGQKRFRQLTITRQHRHAPNRPIKGYVHKAPHRFRSVSVPI
jgi:hypothetical protein